MLICRVQLPEDTALSQTVAAAAPPQNPPPPVATPDTGSRTTTQNSATTTPITNPPTVDGSSGTADPPRPGFIVFLIHHVWNDPHLRICKFQLPLLLSAGLFIDIRARVYSLILPNCGQSTCDVLLSPPSGNRSHILYVLATSNRAFRKDGSQFGFDY